MKYFAALLVLLLGVGASPAAGVFDGIDDSISIPPNANLEITGPLTVALWLKTSDTRRDRGIFQSCQTNTATFEGYVIGVNNWPNTNGFLGYSNGTNYVYGQTVVTNGQWHHVAVAVNSNSATFYADGIFDGTTNTTPPALWQGVRNIGGALFVNLTNDYLFAGQIAEFAVFNRALSAAEIGHLAKSRQTRQPLLLPNRGCVLYYPFTDIPGGASWNGATVKDMSQRGCDGIGKWGTNGAGLYMTGHSPLSGL